MCKHFRFPVIGAFALCALIFISACESEATTQANSPPTSPLLGISPATPTTLDEITVSIITAGVDPESATVLNKYKWLTDGEPQSGLTKSSVEASGTQKSETLGDTRFVFRASAGFLHCGTMPPTFSGILELALQRAKVSEGERNPMLAWMIS